MTAATQSGSSMEDDISLSINELQIIAELDARQFGFLHLNQQEQRTI